jgi:pimeloyl-ACP methyl ester carboxylesterase
MVLSGQVGAAFIKAALGFHSRFKTTSRQFRKRKSMPVRKWLYPSKKSMWFMVFGLAVLTAIPSIAQTTLSANSGINAADTFVIMDFTVQSQATMSLSQPVHSNSTNTNTTSLPLNSIARHFHVEAGFDANDQVVMNIFPTDAPTDPTVTAIDGISKVQIANGTFVIFDTAGNPISFSLPANAPLPNPLALLGLAPGSSVLHGIVVPDINARAAEAHATITMQAAATSAPAGGAAAFTPSVAHLTAALRASAGGTATWTYQSAGSSWILQQVAVTPALPSTQLSRTLQIANVAFNQNSTGDARRAARASTIQPPPSSSSLTFTQPALDSGGANAFSAQQTTTGGSQNMVFQHGIFSSGNTWNRLVPLLSEDFQFGTTLIPSMPALGTIALSTQGTNLFNDMAGSGQSNFLVVGHSQGGLIARDVAQRAAISRPGLAKGVITIDTPNVGALLAFTGRQELANALATGIDDLLSAAGCTSFFDNPGCFVGFLLADFSFPIVNFAFDSTIPASGDLIPGSSYLTTLNSHAENFTRVGIEGHSNKRFVLARLGGDLFSNPEDTFGGRNLAAFTEDVYIGFRACEFIALFFGDFDIAAFCGNIADTMNNIDSFWNDLTAGSDSSDGIVQGASQHYNGATASYVIGDADSHVGATKSLKVDAVLEQTFERQFLVPLRGCTFTIPGSSASFTDLGGTDSMTLTTGSVCPWSAVSNVSWITITAGSSATGTGTVSFAVAPNISPSARSGSVDIAGLMFTVTQSGAPGATGVVMISGFDQIKFIRNPCQPRFFPPCPPPTIIHDSGTVSVTVNGHADSVGYGSGDNALTVAARLATAINNDSAAPVNAGASGGSVFLFAKGSGLSTDYPLSSADTFDSSLFTRPSFTTKDSGSTLLGGH